MEMPTKVTLRMLRRMKGLTQKQLAEELGVSLNEISKVENGKIYRSRLLAERVKKVYGVELDQPDGINDLRPIRA